MSRSARSKAIPFGSTTRRELFPAKDGAEVGPGDYDPSDASSRRIQSDFSILSSRVYFEDKLHNPSPSDHAEPLDWLSSKKKCGQSKTFRPKEQWSKIKNVEVEKFEVPPPASYSPPLQSNCHKSSFSKSSCPQRPIVVDNGIPSSASYDTSRKYSFDRPSPAFECSERGKLFETQGNDATVLSHTAWGMKLACKAAFNCGSERESPFKSSDNPGPSDYVVQGKKEKKGKSKGFGTKHSPYQITDNPGPADYSIGNGRHKSAMKIESGRKELWVLRDGPSPTEYDIGMGDTIERKMMLRSETPEFRSSSRRDVLVNTETNPGPAAYFGDHPSEICGGRISKARRFKKNEYIGGVVIGDSPSPDVYCPELTTRSAFHAVSQRAKFKETTKKDIDFQTTKARSVSQIEVPPPPANTGRK